MSGLSCPGTEVAFDSSLRKPVLRHRFTVKGSLRAAAIISVLPILSFGISSVVPAARAGTLECNTAAVDFQLGIPADWTIVDGSGGLGIVWTTTADPACEIPNRTNGTGEAACADSDAAGSGAPPYDTALVSPPFDLTGVGVATLDVKAYYRDLNTGSNDRFEVDVWDGVTWTTVLSWDEDHEPEDVQLDLSAYAGLAGLQVRFHYFGNGFDWYAQVDDLALRCVPDTAPCDVNADGAVDIGDIQEISANRGTADPIYDIDGDGLVGVLDARQCVLQCDNPRCAP